MLDKLTSLSSGTCHLLKKSLRIANTSENVFARFSLIFLRVLVCLNSVYSDGQDVKYDRDITPHPHFFDGTISHEHSAHRDNRVI